jgi:type I restriction enzyme M protein
MLDNVTKRRIDTARDILVGKVPDPKSQVEQITIALIYKFMDDMDAQAEELGGKRKFFTKEFARFGWAKLMGKGIGGHDLIALYGEGIATMPQNPGIPPLFRDIFKNAYLPYRDPETLKSFLKIIDEFSYDHSERLGDAFEYLLSVLGSQGDAGQFRTPRHIIDFMVEVIAPKKNEVILDPACGTAGFLISAYKYILKQNSTPPQPSPYQGREQGLPPDKGGLRGVSTLTPDEKGRLATNFKGYDISPDMVRLSLVNLYLHGFPDPHIYEYDTLTSDERWNEDADVILANPPFMSPKGGIKPHKRFSIQAKRSEVLFVDYMAEHLTPTGRAGIIVPEGIIFQSQSAYTALRKMLVENSLVAVISLPAGVFQPYSGVKTSILILDKSLARQAQTIAFFKVENDGFGLGAQRRAIAKNDLPQVQAELAAYLQALRSGQPVDELQLSCGLIVAKEKIAANGDYNLSGERYRLGSERAANYPLVELGEIFDITSSKRVFESEWQSDGVPFYRAREIVKLAQEGFVENELFISQEMFEEYSAKYGAPKEDDMMVTGVGTLGICYVVKRGDRFYFKDGNILWLKKKTDTYTVYVRHMFQTDFVRRQIEQTAGATVGTFTIINAKKTKIPLPPLEVQKEIVAEIEGYQKVINGARAVLDHYRPHIPIHPDWPMATLGEICDVRDGTHDSPKYVPDGYPLITSKNLKNGYIDFSDVNLISREDLDAINKRSKVDDGDILMPMIGTIGNPMIADTSREYAVKNVALIKFHKDSKVDNRFLKDVLASAEMQSHFDRQASGSTQKFIPLGFIRSLPIPLPPLATQHQIVAEIEAEQALVAANRELITRFEQKIQATLARVWGSEEELAANHIHDAAGSQARVRIIPQRLKAISTSK